MVPPVCPRPRPDILATVSPVADASGPTTSVVLSPTPPVECLSTLTPGNDERSIISPDSAIASVISVVSLSVMPCAQIAINSAASCSLGIVFATQPVIK